MAQTLGAEGSKVSERELPRPEAWACHSIEVIRETPEVKQENARGQAQRTVEGLKMAEVSPQ